MERMTSVMLMLVMMIGVFIESSRALECYRCDSCDDAPSKATIVSCGNICVKASYEVAGALRFMLLD